MKVRLVVPKSVMRPVRMFYHFEPRTIAEIKSLPDEDVRTILLKNYRKQPRPYGHDSIWLKCGHTLTRVRKHPGPVLYRLLPCEMCTRRDQEMTVRYIRSDIKKKRRAKKAAKRGKIVVRQSQPPSLRIRLKRKRNGKGKG